MSEGTRRCSFGLYELEMSTGELRRAGRPVHLAPQPTRLLLALVEHPGQIVARDELKSSIWGSQTFVDFEQGLKYCVKQLRAALDDDAENPRFVETVPRRGYRFIAPVQAVPPAGLPAFRSAVHGRLVRTLLLPGLAAVVVPAAIYIGWVRVGLALATPARTTIAVLPFKNVSGDPDQEFFSDGFTADLIAQLARIDPARLGVIAQTSTLALKESTTSAARIGSDLHVQHVVEGTVRRSGNRVRVNVELIRVADQSYVWADIYEGEIRDILALQSQVGRAVARQVVASVGPATGTVRRPIDPDVYDLYLRGRFAWNRRTRSEIDKAAAFFEEAVRRDPTFAPAHAGLADALMARSRPAALIAAERALALDDRLAEAHTARAHALMHLLQWNRAAEEFRQAIALDASYVPARYFYAEYLVARNRGADAVAEAQQGLALDPLSAVATHTVGVMLYYAHRYDEALPYLRRALELDPEHTWSHGRIALVLERQQSYGAALAEFEKADVPTRMAYTYGAAGMLPDAQRIIGAALAQPDLELHAYHLAGAYVGIGAYEEALKWLAVALRNHEYDVVYMAVDPRLEPLHARPEFQELLREGGWAASAR